MTAKVQERSKILVVDDEKLILLAMSAKLRAGGYTPVAFGDLHSAIEAFKKAPWSFSAIITDIMMGDMDGFIFRDVVRGIDSTMPMFFLTALDPEEGGGFLKRILADPQSYYLPKSVKSEVLLKRIQRIVASRRIERFIENKVEEDKKNLELAAHIQLSMLPANLFLAKAGFYSSWWKPLDVVSGDLFEATQVGTDSCIYVVGDIQGHGTNAALAMTAVQSFLKQMTHMIGFSVMRPFDIANELQRFFRTNLGNVSYMTALICHHRPSQGEVRWISCGAPDLIVVEGGEIKSVNSDNRGGMPIGLMPDTEYTAEDEVCTAISKEALCIAYTDGVLDLTRNGEETDKMPHDLFPKLCRELVPSSRTNGSVMALPYKFLPGCAAMGYGEQQDDMTIIVFGSTLPLPGIYEAALLLTPAEVDKAAQAMGEWCKSEGWGDDIIGRVQVVLEEKLMNIHDHGYKDRDLLMARVGFRLRRFGNEAELTVWDAGTPEPSIQVVAGDAATVFEKANLAMRDHGRGRLMVRELCEGIERNTYAGLNETIYHVPFNREKEGG